MKFFASLCVIAFFVAAPARCQMQGLGPKDTFSAAGLSADETRQIIAGVEKSAYDTPDSWEKELRVKRVMLGDVPGVVVQGTGLLCGGTGNCQTWVFRKSGGKWMSLFDEKEDAPIAEGFELGPGVTNGVKDLTIRANLSAEKSKQVTFKFDGKLYRAK